MKFSKYHALGNDYVVVERDQFRRFDTPDNIERICADHFGIGADGILVHEENEGSNRFLIRILNPDGSEAEKSGNGLRIFARYLWDRQLVCEEAFTVKTAGGDVSCRVKHGGRIVTVDMGRVTFNSHDIPVAGPPRDVINEKIQVNGQTITYSAASIGNPHCVVVRDRVTSEEAQKLGPLIETEPCFLNLTNVQFLQVMDRKNLWIEIWERGVGYTLASGTSSCAAAAVARRLDLCDADVTVHMPGGKLQIELSADYEVRMIGPVVKVADGELCDEIFGVD
jgi:diaminopimelate epimerase